MWSPVTKKANTIENYLGLEGFQRAIQPDWGKVVTAPFGGVKGASHSLTELQKILPY